MVYLGAKLFEDGQTNVALSRVRSMQGVRMYTLMYVDDDHVSIH